MYGFDGQVSYGINPIMQLIVYVVNAAIMGWPHLWVAIHCLLSLLLSWATFIGGNTFSLVKCFIVSWCHFKLRNKWELTSLMMMMIFLCPCEVREIGYVQGIDIMDDVHRTWPICIHLPLFCDLYYVETIVVIVLGSWSRKVELQNEFRQLVSIHYLARFVFAWK